MTTGPARSARPSRGGNPARRAMVRWAWRLFRREWRQQFLILALVIVAVGATVVGSAVATDSVPPSTSTFGTAQDLAALAGSTPRLSADIAALEHRFGKVDVIENQTMHVPGSVQTYQLRAQDPHGAFGAPLLSLVSGRFPESPGQVAMTQGLASTLRISVGDVWHEGGTARQVVGIVQNPDSLLDQFALVTPGQVHAPTQVTVLFDAHGVTAQSLGRNVRSRNMTAPTGLNPTTIVLALATVGMLLIALVGVGGFTVLAQRRLRAIGMVESLGATDRDVRFTVRANGVVVGVVGAVLGLAVGFAAWLAYRPTAEADSHHLIGVLALPWNVIAPALALAVLATYFAAARPARAITKVPIVAALSGRPAPPRQVHRSAVPGVVLLVGAFFLFTVAASLGNGGIAVLVPAFVVLIVAVILLAPFCLSVLARLGRRSPVAVRLALRDLARYRARSSAPLAAISLGVLIAVIISVIAAGRYGNVLDYTGPNLASNQLVIYTATGPSGGQGPGTKSARTAQQPTALQSKARSLASALGSRDVVTLETTSASLLYDASGRNFSGPVYVATPSLLRAFDVPASQVHASADILTMRPGFSNLSKMLLVYGNYFTRTRSQGPSNTAFPCPTSTCLANPKIEEVHGLPAGTSAPNTVITERAVRALHLQVRTAGWFVQLPAPLSASQIANARLAAAAAGMSIETKSGAPSSSEVINWATVFAIALALCVLAMSVGLIRSETAKDLRTLAASGASSFARRTITATTAGGLALLGAILGTVGGYVAAVAFFRSNANTSGLSALSHTPVANLLFILVGMPLIAVIAGWLLGGREPPMMARQPIE